MFDFDDEVLDLMPEGDREGEKPTLYYFTGAGRGELTRLAFQAGGVPFIDKRITMDEWKRISDDPESPPSQCFGRMPVIVHKDHTFSQSIACATYAADLGINRQKPKTARQRSIDAMVLGAQADMHTHLYVVIFGPSEKFREREKANLPPKLKPFLDGIERLFKGPGPFLYSQEEHGPSLGDLCILDLVTSDGPGLNNMDIDLSSYPKIRGCVEAVLKSKVYPKLSEYISSRGF